MIASILLLLIHANDARAQASENRAANAPTASGLAVLHGEVATALRRGNPQRTTRGSVHLVPDSLIASLAPACTARDSLHDEYVRLRRPVRLAYEDARLARERQASPKGALLFAARVVSARTGADAARERLARQDADIVAAVRSQRTAPIGEGGRYRFDDVAPGAYMLYADSTATPFWFVSMQIAAGEQRRDPGLADAQTGLDPIGTAGDQICLLVTLPALLDRSAEAVEAIETRPRLQNGREISRSLERRFPPVIQGVGGEVVVKARVLEDGTVDPESVHAIRTTVDAAARSEAEAAAELVVEEMRFSPARLGERVVKAWIVIPLVFVPPPR